MSVWDGQLELERERERDLRLADFRRKKKHQVVVGDFPNVSFFLCKDIPDNSLSQLKHCNKTIMVWIKGCHKTAWNGWMTHQPPNTIEFNDDLTHSMACVRLWCLCVLTFNRLGCMGCVSDIAELYHDALWGMREKAGQLCWKPWERIWLCRSQSPCVPNLVKKWNSHSDRLSTSGNMMPLLLALLPNVIFILKID